MSRENRQVGEAVAWRERQLHHAVNGPITAWQYSDREPPARMLHRWEIQPLVPASDLEQVSRERDEAVRLLREARTDLANTRTNIMVELNKYDNQRWEGVPEAIKSRIALLDAFLNNLDNRNDGR